MISSTCIALRLTLGGNRRQRIHGSAPHIMMLSLKIASHSMHPKGEVLPRQPWRAIATSLRHLPRRLSQAKGSLALIPLVGSSHIEGGLNMGLLLQALLSRSSKTAPTVSIKRRKPNPSLKTLESQLHRRRDFLTSTVNSLKRGIKPGSPGCDRTSAPSNK
jgi:hypothetical protein